MRVYHPTDRPWDHVRIPPAWATGLPDVADLVADAQLGPVALLQAAASVTESALLSRYGACGDISDEVFEHPTCSAPFIARLLLIRCRELTDLLAAYRIAIQRDSDDSDEF